MRRLIDHYIQQYGRRLYGLCRSLCSNSFDADDLYQETWLRVVKHISKYDPDREERDYAPLYEAVNKLPEKLLLTVILFYFRGETCG